MVMYFSMYTFIIPTADQTAISVLCNVCKISVILESLESVFMITFIAEPMADSNWLLSVLWDHPGKNV